METRETLTYKTQRENHTAESKQHAFCLERSKILLWKTHGSVHCAHCLVSLLHSFLRRNGELNGQKKQQWNSVENSGWLHIHSNAHIKYAYSVCVTHKKEVDVNARCVKMQWRTSCGAGVWDEMKNGYIELNRPATRKAHYPPLGLEKHRRKKHDKQFSAAIIQSGIIASQNAEINCWINQLRYTQRGTSKKCQSSGEAQKHIRSVSSQRSERKISLDQIDEKSCFFFRRHSSFYRCSIYDMKFAVISFRKQSHPNTHTHTRLHICHFEWSQLLWNSVEYLPFYSLYCFAHSSAHTILPSLFYSAGCEVIKSKYLSYVCFFDTVFSLLPSRFTFRNEIGIKFKNSVPPATEIALWHR